ncbi:MAG TPA: AAA family ATPase [Solirubrobacteraceae bacterium]|jgi:predicted ATPase/DNA-binding NarL/FixJ family response regulator|nr:AAA family ATPase [Solirubrobacteraceae bacterium]
MASGLVGRRAEFERLEALLERARAGEGAVVLLSGEAGVGKTRLMSELAGRADGALVLCAATTQGRTAPYGPLVGILRGYLHARPGGLDGCGPLRAHLARIVPELGEPAPDTDRATLFEAIRCALARTGPALLILDDLQWSDEATLEVLAALAAPLAELPLLVIAAYRSDGLPRVHSVRRLRNDLRRAGRLEEVALGPLEPGETAQLLERRLGEAPAPSLARAIQDRTEGIPFFVEELAAALRVNGSLRPGPHGIELVGDGEVPLPDTVRDAVLIGFAELPGACRRAAEVAAVAGERFDLAVVAGLSSEDGLTQLLESGLARERDGAGAFRHALTREAIHLDVPWMQRRAIHRSLAEALERRGADSRDVAPHWLGAHDEERARAALAQAAAQSEAVHAYRDAADAGRRALELWPDGAASADRTEVLERHARCTQLTGELAEAAWAWREVIAHAGDESRVARAQRSLAAVHELRGDREAAVAARLAAAAVFAASGSLAEAAVERIAIANQRRLAARHGEAIELAARAREDAERAGRMDLRVRAMGVEGMARAKHGDYQEGLRTVRAGLALALEHDLTAIAAELYQRLSVTLYESADYRRAEEALDTALELCRTNGDEATVGACVSCLAYVLRERGEWARATEICRDMIAGGSGVFVAEGLLGAIHAHEGRFGSARRLLSSSLAVSTQLGHYNMTVDSTAALARVAAAEGDGAEAAARCHAVLARWEQSDDHHYALAPLRWAACFFAGTGDRPGAQACAGALTGIASATGHADALAALAHAIAETALLEGDTATAVDQLTRAMELHRDLDLPFERAQVELRAGVALAAAGEHELAVERLCDAYRTARKLGARPLAAAAANELAALGESVVARLGVRAEADADGAGLSRREREVVRLVAVGRTNREIARDLFLSPRTVDMHVRNILRKLDCRSRVEAAGRARELGLTA